LTSSKANALHSLERPGRAPRHVPDEAIIKSDRKTRPLRFVVMAPKPHSTLEGLAELSESAKSVSFAAFHLHLLGLNARVLATKLGEKGRAFSVLSNEWVVLGSLFESSMHRLQDLTETLLRGLTRSMIRGKRARLLRECEADFKKLSIQIDHDETGAAGELLKVRSELQSLVDEAVRGCLLGRVIARSAKIEAGWSTDSRDVLTALANDFEAQLASILPSLRTLDSLQREGLR
jgi:hypothetical protein